MKIEYYHASKYGNGAAVAEEFKRLMTARGTDVNVHHINDVRPEEVPQADLYVFSSPGRIGKPIGSMRRFLKGLKLPPGAPYALLTTEMPSNEQTGKWQKITSTMDEILRDKGLKKIAEGRITIAGIKGPLADGWEKAVEEFTAKITTSA